MTAAEMEHRLLVLEHEVAQLKAQRTTAARFGGAAHSAPAAAPENEQAAPEEMPLLPGVEYPLALDVPPAEEYLMRGKIVAIEEGPHGAREFEKEGEVKG